MYIGIKRWKGRDWVSSLLILIFLALHLIVAGYPILYWDSIRYLRSAVILTPSPFSPTLVCYLIKPLITLMGAWGFAVFQIILLTYVLVSALKFFHQNFIVGITSIILSAAGYFAIHVMMDIYTAVGLLALFLILQGEKDIFLYIIVSICYIAHYENLFLFPLCAVIYLMVFNRKKMGPVLLPIIALFIIPLIVAILTNYRSEKGFRFFPKTKYSMIATRIMADSPEITRSYMEKHPDSSLIRYKEFYAYAMTKAVPSDTLFWDEEQGLAWRPEFSPEIKKFIVYVLKNYKLGLLKNALKNTYRFLMQQPPYIIGPIDNKTIDSYITECFPHQLKYAKNSLQYKGKLLPINFKLLYLTYNYAVYPVILFFILLSFINREIRNSSYYRFAVFSAILILANALIMPNFVVIQPRYLGRVMLIPCLAMSLIVADFFKRHPIGRRCRAPQRDESLL